MKKNKLFSGTMLIILILSGCTITDFEREHGDFTVTVTPGDEWFHDYTIWGPITKKNPPTFAVWLTNSDGDFLETLFVTRKIGLSAWISNQDNRRIYPLYIGNAPGRHYAEIVVGWSFTLWRQEFLLNAGYRYGFAEYVEKYEGTYLTVRRLNKVEASPLYLGLSWYF